MRRRQGRNKRRVHFRFLPFLEDDFDGVGRADLDGVEGETSSPSLEATLSVSTEGGGTRWLPLVEGFEGAAGVAAGVAGVGGRGVAGAGTGARGVTGGAGAGVVGVEGVLTEDSMTLRFLPYFTSCSVLTFGI